MGCRMRVGVVTRRKGTHLVLERLGEGLRLEQPVGAGSPTLGVPNARAELPRGRMPCIRCAAG